MAGTPTSTRTSCGDSPSCGCRRHNRLKLRPSCALGVSMTQATYGKPVARTGGVHLRAEVGRMGATRSRDRCPRIALPSRLWQGSHPSPTLPHVATGGRVGPRANRRSAPARRRRPGKTTSAGVCARFGRLPRQSIGSVPLRGSCGSYLPFSHPRYRTIHRFCVAKRRQAAGPEARSSRRLIVATPWLCGDCRGLPEPVHRQARRRQAADRRIWRQSVQDKTLQTEIEWIRCGQTLTFRFRQKSFVSRAFRWRFHLPRLNHVSPLWR